ncbi:hypothetical protein JCM10212_001070 [Sporobolomyces blumeae]
MSGAPGTSSYSNPHTNPPPPPLSMAGGPPQQGPSVLQILAMGQERNHAADAVAHHPRIESLIKLGKESEATWLQIGQTAEAMGDLDRAVASYESALRHNAYSIVALSQIAAICRSKEEFKKAAEYFGRVVGIAPESGDVWGALGHCYLMIDDLKKAYSSYQQALYYMPNPHEPKLWYGIGILYDRYGSLEHAEEAFSSVIRMDPNFEKSNEIFFRLGIIYKQQRKSQQSLECFRYILTNPPRPLTEIDIWFQIGHVYEQQQDFIAAKESYERVLQENPAHAKVLQQLGGLYHRSHAPFYNPEISEQILTKSLESDPNDPFSWYLLGRAYMTTSNFGKAYEAYQQAVYRDGKNPAFWCSIGVLYYNINQFHDALDAYSRAIRIHPYLAEVWFNLGALYEACNDQMTDAIDAYQRTLQLDPANQVVAHRLREIREHQATNAQLSPPPPPKDISPNSSSWNYATNTGGAPAALSQSGLAPEPSPTMAPNGHPARSTNGGSPPTTAHHRFDGPPPTTAGSRPRSTDPYRRPSGGEDRRRVSGAHGHHSPSASIDQSPRAVPSAGPSGRMPVNGTASSSVLPQIKNVHDRPAQMVASNSRANSPPSPRTRAQPDGPSAHSDRYPPPPGHGPYPFPSHLSQSQPHPSGTPQRPGPHQPSVYEMDWDRSHRAGGPAAPPRNGSSHGRMPPPGSPPGSSHAPAGPGFAATQAHAVPPHAHAYERSTSQHPAGPSPRPHFFDNPATGPPAGYPYPQSATGAAVAYQRERDEEMARRRSSGSTTSGSGGKPTPGHGATNGSGGPPPPPAALQGSRSLESPQPVTAPPSATGRGRGGRTKKDEGEKKEPTARGGRKAKAKGDSATDGESTPKRKTKAAKEKEEKAAEKAAAKAAAVLTGGASSARPPPPPPPPAPAPAPPAPTPMSTAPQQTPPPARPAQASVAPKREVDEDYDEGVDALMGLAASGHTPQPPPPQALPSASPAPPAASSAPQQPPPPAPPAPAPAPASLAPPPSAPSAAASPSPAPATIPAPVASKPSSPNPRKRTLPETDDAATANGEAAGPSTKTTSEGEPEPKKSKNEAPSPPRPAPAPAPAPPRSPPRPVGAVPDSTTATTNEPEEAEEGEIDESKSEVKSNGATSAAASGKADSPMKEVDATKPEAVAA